MKALRLFAFALAAILVACNPSTPTAAPTLTGAPAVGTAPPVVATVVPGPLGTPLPSLTSLPASTPTPIPPLPSGLSPTELKYRVLDRYPGFFFCDPDLYPVASADELGLARQRLPQIHSNTDMLEAILARHQLSGLTVFTDEQILTIYRDYKKLQAIPFQTMGDGYQFEIQIGPEGQGYAIAGTIDSAGTIAEQQRTPTVTACPRCLARGTLIDTPYGPVAVESLRVGMPVWTAAPNGNRIEGVVLKAAEMPVPPDHHVVRVSLADGRALLASPAHPTADGRTLSDLLPGALLDGSRITRIERISYTGAATYDILPSGLTGFYWANGILVGSTLAGN